MTMCELMHNLGFIHENFIVILDWIVIHVWTHMSHLMAPLPILIKYVHFLSKSNLISHLTNN
jgi:hypothetical protein